MMRNKLACLTALGLLTVACADDVPPTPATSEGTTTDGDTTTTGPVDPTTTSVTNDTTSVGETEDTTMGGLDSSSGGESSSGGATCGDDMAEGAEVCDGTDLVGEDCITQGFDAGEIACAADCAAFDTSGCVMFSCGDDLAEGAEVCDGTDLAGEDCISQGFDAGALACDAGCMAFDTSGCVMFSCGNDLLEGMEVCDGTDLSGEDCISQGFDAGALACDAGCMAFDTTGCVTFMCGNDLIEGAEVCDGADLGGEDCISQGFAGGVLGCDAMCAGYDTVGCTCLAEEDVGVMTGPAVTTGSTVGEDDTLPISCAGGGGADRVISFTATAAGDYTFDTFGSGYDTALAVFSSCAAGAEIACNDDAMGLLSEVTVNLAAGQTAFVVVDGFSGATGDWVLNIDWDCVETDIMSAVGAAVATGTTVGEDEDLPQSCAAGGSVDHVVHFVAPVAADYVFDTLGSGYDTALSLHAGCSVADFACNDDEPGGTLQSQLQVNLAAGQEVFIAVSGFFGSTGDWVLNITQL